jgi:hypothetical protein
VTHRLFTRCSSRSSAKPTTTAGTKQLDTDLAAPLLQWGQYRAFDSAEACEKERAAQRQEVTRSRDIRMSLLSNPDPALADAGWKRIDALGTQITRWASRALPAREPGASAMIRSALGRLAETLVLAWAVGAVLIALFALVGCTQG